MIKNCLVCNKEFKSKPSDKAKYCSFKCYALSKKGKPTWNKGTKGVMKAWNKGKKYPQVTGSKNWNWKGGKRKSSQGYIFILKPNHPGANNQGYVKRSNLVIEKKIGRFLKPKEVVHHKGIKYPLGSIENKQDDRIENLMLFKNNGKHHKYHWKNPIYHKKMSLAHKKIFI